MDCEAFDSALLDALYPDDPDAPEAELPASTIAAMDAHAAGCEACAKRRTNLRATRELVRGALEVPLPEGLEARLLAVAERRPRKGGVIAFLSRPQFALAAAFVLVLGAAALFATPAKMRMAEDARTDRAPAAAAEPSPAPVPGEPPPAPVAVATETAPLAKAPAAAPVTAAAPGAAAPPIAAGKAAPAKGAAGPAATRAPDDDAFASAQALFAERRYAEALPRFEALAPNNPEAALYAARSVAQTQGCAAARPRFEAIARRAPGSDVARRATIEASRCAPAPATPTANTLQ